MVNERSDNKKLLKLFIDIIKGRENLDEKNLKEIKEQLLDNGKLIIGGGLIILPGSFIILPIIKLVADKLKLNLKIEKTFKEEKTPKKYEHSEYSPL